MKQWYALYVLLCSYANSLCSKMRFWNGNRHVLISEKKHVVKIYPSDIETSKVWWCRWEFGGTSSLRKLLIKAAAVGCWQLLDENQWNSSGIIPRLLNTVHDGIWLSLHMIHIVQWIANMGFQKVFYGMIWYMLCHASVYDTIWYDMIW